MTDKGQFASREITIMPCANGSFLVVVGRGGGEEFAYRLMQESAIAFSNYRDLLAFLSADYEAAAEPSQD